jgi:hypothetical protein
MPRFPPLRVDLAILLLLAAAVALLIVAVRMRRRRHRQRSGIHVDLVSGGGADEPSA